MNVPMHDKNLPVANISNQLAFNLSWHLTFREWNVVLFLVSKLDSKNQETFREQVVSVKELEAALKSTGAKWGGLYKELEKLRKSLMRKPIDFYTDVVVDGKPLRGGVNFFEMIVPERGPDDTVQLRFKFTGSVKPLLLQLKSHFVSIPQEQTKLIKNGHAIRFLIAAKAKRDMMRSHEAISSLKYGLDGFRMFLGIPEQYTDFRNLKRYVIFKIEKEVNDKCAFLEIVEVKFYPENGKPKTEVEFFIADRNVSGQQQLAFPLQESWMPSDEDIKGLSRAKKRAYETLTAYHVSEGIAFQQILPKIGGSEIVGFEDWYIERLLTTFDNKTKKKKSDKKGRAGAFVKWFLSSSFRDNQFPDVMEHIHKKKKQLQIQDPDAWSNRQMAKDMTDAEFEAYYRSRKQEKVTITHTAAPQTGGFSSIADLLKNKQ